MSASADAGLARRTADSPQGRTLRSASSVSDESGERHGGSAQGSVSSATGLAIPSAGLTAAGSSTHPYANQGPQHRRPSAQSSGSGRPRSVNSSVAHSLRSGTPPTAASGARPGSRSRILASSHSASADTVPAWREAPPRSPPRASDYGLERSDTPPRGASGGYSLPSSPLYSMGPSSPKGSQRSAHPYANLSASGSRPALSPGSGARTRRYQSGPGSVTGVEPMPEPVPPLPRMRSATSESQSAAASAAKLAPPGADISRSTSADNGSVRLQSLGDRTVSSSSAQTMATSMSQSSLSKASLNGSRISLEDAARPLPAKTSLRSRLFGLRKKSSSGPTSPPLSSSNYGDDTASITSSQADHSFSPPPERGTRRERDVSGGTLASISSSFMSRSSSRRSAAASDTGHGGSASRSQAGGLAFLSEGAESTSASAAKAYRDRWASAEQRRGVSETDSSMEAQGACEVPSAARRFASVDAPSTSARPQLDIDAASSTLDADYSARRVRSASGTATASPRLGSPAPIDSQGDSTFLRLGESVDERRRPSSAEPRRSPPQSAPLSLRPMTAESAASAHRPPSLERASSYDRDGAQGRAGRTSRQRRHDSVSSWTTVASSAPAASPAPRTSSLRPDHGLTPLQPLLPPRSSSSASLSPSTLGPEPSPLLTAAEGSITRSVDSPRGASRLLDAPREAVARLEAGSASPAAAPAIKVTAGVAALAARFESSQAGSPGPSTRPSTADSGRAATSPLSPGAGAPAARSGLSEASAAAAAGSGALATIRARFGPASAAVVPPSLARPQAAPGSSLATSPAKSETTVREHVPMELVSPGPSEGGSQDSALRRDPMLGSPDSHESMSTAYNSMPAASRHASISMTEEEIYATPPLGPQRFSDASAVPSLHAGSPTEDQRRPSLPSLPPKNPLRNRRTPAGSPTVPMPASPVAVPGAAEGRTPPPLCITRTTRALSISPLRSSIEVFGPQLAGFGMSPGDTGAQLQQDGEDISPGSAPVVQPVLALQQENIALDPAPAAFDMRRGSSARSGSSSGQGQGLQVAPPVPSKAQAISLGPSSLGSDIVLVSEQGHDTPEEQPPTPHKYSMGLRKAGPESPSADEGHGKRKSSKRWPFSGHSGKESKAARAARKSEASRPQIRRVFDSPHEADEAERSDADTGADLSPRPGMSRSGSSSRQVGGLLHTQESLPSLRKRPSFESQSSQGRFSDAARTPDTSLGSPAHFETSHASAGRSSLNNSTAMPSPNIAREDLTPEGRRALNRCNVLRELVETEKSYAADLVVVRDIYLARARARCGMLSPALSTPMSALSHPLSPNSAFPTPMSASSSSVFLPHRNVSGGTAAPPLPSSRSTAASSASNLSAASSLAASTIAPQTLASPASLHSSNPSNRSSTFTVSSNTSITSDSHPPPLPATPPMATSGSNGSMSTSTSASALTLHAGAELSPGLGASSKPLMHINTAGGGLFSPKSVVSPSQTDAPLSPLDIRVVFAHLESCAAFADEMALSLQENMGQLASTVPTAENLESASQDDTVGRVFLSMMPRIEQVYTAYCSRHEMSMTRLNELNTASPKAAAFLRECTEAARAQTNAWDLGSLLIKPVQRVLKYPLLIQQILSNTPAEHPDFKNLQAALVEITQVADNINEVKKRQDLVDQVLSGKSANGRTASQKVQHGATKRLMRRSERVKGALVGPSMELVSDDYPRLATQFTELHRSVHRFARRCVDWSAQTRVSYDAEIKVLEQLASVYRLSRGDDETPLPLEEDYDATPEERVRALVAVLRSILDGSWQQLDSDIRSTIVPMTQRLGQMFDNPKSVMAKRNDREMDYARYRAAMTKSGKTPDRAIIDSANAFVALHAQLLDELPQFIYGIQTLLDVGLQAFARLQATHHLHVRRARLEFWREHAALSGAADDVVVDPDTQELTIRHVQAVRSFWRAHQEVAATVETLGIAVRDSTPSAAPSESGHRNASLSAFSAAPSSLKERRESVSSSARVVSSSSASSAILDTSSAPFETRSSASGPGLLLPTTTGRRSGGGVASLMRSLSGNFSREASPSTETPPPLPNGAAALRSDGAPPAPVEKDRVAALPPSLPLTFKTTGRDSWFVLNARDGPIDLPFLNDLEETGVTLEPYDLSPELAASSLPSVESHDEVLRAPEAPKRAPPPPPPPSGAAPDGRQKMRVIASLMALSDSPRRDPKGRLGWPWLTFTTGQEVAVLSYDPGEGRELLFGRGEDGVLGWSERDLFTAV